jgi:hypothetical protein
VILIISPGATVISSSHVAWKAYVTFTYSTELFFGGGGAGAAAGGGGGAGRFDAGLPGLSCGGGIPDGNFGIPATGGGGSVDSAGIPGATSLLGGGKPGPGILTAKGRAEN